jgi:hypothetical protein
MPVACPLHPLAPFLTFFPQLITHRSPLPLCLPPLSLGSIPHILSSTHHPLFPSELVKILLVRPIPLITADFSWAAYSLLWWWEQYEPQKRRSTLRLHGVISQEDVIFILTAMRICNLNIDLWGLKLLELLQLNSYACCRATVHPKVFKKFQIYFTSSSKSYLYLWHVILTRYSLLLLDVSGKHIRQATSLRYLLPAIWNTEITSTLQWYPKL